MRQVGSSISITAALLTLICMAAAPAASATEESAEYAPVCSHASAGLASCQAIRLLRPATGWHGFHLRGELPARAPGKRPGQEVKSQQLAPQGYGPAELQSAYGLAAASASRGAGETVAVVDAYDDPNAEADLNAYRAKFGLGECTKANGCFAKVNQEGGTGYPNGNASWGQEISLDIDMVSAICPSCRILLVEARSASFANLGAAEDYAARHADAISNSYGGSEGSAERSYDAYYDHPGVAITVSAGDSGYRAEYPAASPFVTAVGGTTLSRAGDARGWSEAVWSGSGAGCSAYEASPGWQPLTVSCSRRTIADVAADANPNTGVAVYDSYGTSGWLVFGGTSVSSPIIASVYALAGNTQSFTTNASGSDAAEALYFATTLNRVREGFDLNARRCGTYLCGAPFSVQSWRDALGESLTGWYNGPTGNGTPNGLVGF